MLVLVQIQPPLLVFALRLSEKELSKPLSLQIG